MLLIIIKLESIYLDLMHLQIMSGFLLYQSVMKIIDDDHYLIVNDY
jgi:hypothetical protein